MESGCGYEKILTAVILIVAINSLLLNRGCEASKGFLSDESRKSLSEPRVLFSSSLVTAVEEHLTCDWTPNITVAKDGSGDYSTIGEAVAFVPGNSPSRFIIHVKKGLYRENVIVPHNKPNVVMYGDGSTKTVVAGGLNRIDNPSLKTFQTATFSVRGDGFVARDMRFVNTAGPRKEQAVAFHSRSNFTVMFRCTFEAFQDTLYAHTGDQFYRECDIIGTVDFIFGYASAVFQKCKIWPRKPQPEQVNTVTAQGETDQNRKTAFSIVNCEILPFRGENSTVYLGRPWKNFSRVAVMKTLLGYVVDPKGWLPWNNDPVPTTLSYGEYKNYGPGSGLNNRVHWIGYKPVMSDQDAHDYTVGILINQNGWLSQTCVPYDLGL